MRRSLRRQAVTPALQSQSDPYTFVAPVRGWIANENLANSKKGGALRLENWFPTSTGIRLRSGMSLHATIGTDPVESAWAYSAGSTKRLFAADETNVFNITAPADPEVAPTADVTGQTSGEYATAHFATAAGTFLYAVNGTDPALLYDGSAWWEITDESTYALAFDAQTANFTNDDTLTGSTSGATATIISQVDNGTDGTLYVKGIINGPFTNDETITDSGGGSADANIPSGVVEAQSVVINNVDTSTLSHVWVYKNRLYFVKKDTLVAWYLPSGALGGNASDMSLAGVFQNGGYLLFGGTWSIDAGDGVDDKCVFVSSEGEVAIYEGSAPSENDWALVGRYEITKPLGKNATMRAGGDLVILTEDGMVPLSAALNKDKAALSLAAVSKAIEPEWKTRVIARREVPWQVVKWPSYNMAIVSQPVIDDSTPAECLVVNLETGAWCLYTGWNVRSLVLHNDRVYFGSNGGEVFLAESGGTDNGASYTCTYVGLWDHMGNYGAVKDMKLARGIFRTGWPFTPKISVSVNYAVNLPAAPDAYVSTPADNAWDVGNWDEAIWNGVSELQVRTKWSAIGKTGYAIAPQVQVTVSQVNDTATELVAFDVMRERGGIVN